MGWKDLQFKGYVKTKNDDDVDDDGNEYDPDDDVDDDGNDNDHDLDATTTMTQISR